MEKSTIEADRFDARRFIDPGNILEVAKCRFSTFHRAHGSTRCEDGWVDIYVYIGRYSEYKLILQIILQFSSSCERIALDIG